MPVAAVALTVLMLPLAPWLARNLLYVGLPVAGLVGGILFYGGGTEEDRKAMLWMAISVLVFLPMCYLYLVKLKHRWHHPFFLFFSWLFAFLFFGTYMYFVRKLFFAGYPGEITTATLAGTVALAGVVCGYGFTACVASLGTMGKRPRIELASVREWDSSRANILNWGLIALGWVAAFMIFQRFTLIPLFSDDVDAMRVVVNKESAGYLWPVWMLLFQSIPLSFVHYWFRGKGIGGQIALALKVTLALVPLTFYASRFLMLFPFLVTLVLYIYLRRPDFSIQKAFYVFVTIMAFAMAFVAYRIFGGELTSQHFFKAFLADFFPEVRTFATALVFVDPEPLTREVFGTVIAGLFPSKLLSLLGFDKSELWQPIGEIILNFFPWSANILGLRTSFVGEIYLAASIRGVLISMLVIGVILYFLDCSVQRHAMSVTVFPTAVLTALLIALVPYGTIFIITTVWVFTPSYLILLVCRGKKLAMDMTTEAA
jgi:hypothetical protein